MRGIWIGQEVDKYKTGVKYSYYTILILDTVQPIVNSPKLMESYGTHWKPIESPTSSYVMLEWTVIEHSGMFWIMVQGKEKWKKMNKV